MTARANRIEGVAGGTVVPVSGTVTTGAGSTTDVTDRAARLLGVVASITAAVDVSDRLGRLLGAVQGDVANDGVNTGNPLQDGGRASLAVPTDVSADGDRVAAWHTRNGAKVAVIGSTVNAADAASNVEQRLFPLSAASTEKLGIHGYLYNGATWDRMREIAAADAQAVTGLLAAAGLVFNGTNWDRIRGSSTEGLHVNTTPGTAGRMLVQTGLSAANTAQTITLAALGSGHYAAIDYIFISRVATAALVGTAALNYTTTNLNGLAWTVGNAMAVGATQIDVAQSYAVPLIAATSNLAVTIVIPACGANVVSRVTVCYRDLTNM